MVGIQKMALQIPFHNLSKGSSIKVNIVSGRVMLPVGEGCDVG